MEHAVEHGPSSSGHDARASRPGPPDPVAEWASAEAWHRAPRPLCAWPMRTLPFFFPSKLVVHFVVDIYI